MIYDEINTPDDDQLIMEKKIFSIERKEGCHWERKDKVKVTRKSSLT
jgi:hypothetical protein